MNTDIFFRPEHIPMRGKGLTFDDVLLVPQKSEVRSRRLPQLDTPLTKNHRIQIPIISANMDTVTESAMALAMWQLGGVGILHRFLPIEEQAKQVRELKAQGVKPLAASIGVNEEDRKRALALVQAGVDILTLDIAHGHSVQMLDTLKWCKDHFPHIDIIAGNMATPEAAEELIEAGADAVKVGIGPGSMCTTRIITGCGVPQLTAVALCAQVTKEKGIPLIADGGIKTSGDIVKALAAGAQSVMLGSLLAGTIETPGEIHNGKKHYRGMASKAAQESWRGGVPEGMAPEGESTQVPVKGHVRDVVLELTGGIRSGMSYLNAMSLVELHKNARFVEMTPHGYNESKAHGVKPT
ncbi:MAG: IMP dehydrogenase [Bdellovibrionaceae bacterium]|jgi:IMP dehydrogenase|nr:IMP dehydrogenase [Pseudobdellovibrionaceae bacterium]